MVVEFTIKDFDIEINIVFMLIKIIIISFKNLGMSSKNA
jgi:hypothetical protein